MKSKSNNQSRQIKSKSVLNTTFKSADTNTQSRKGLPKALQCSSVKLGTSDTNTQRTKPIKDFDSDNDNEISTQIELCEYNAHRDKRC